MTESFIHYLWQYQQFDYSKACLVDNSNFKVLKTGFLNTNAGPDFINSSIIIEAIEWAGTIEIHIKSSDWNLHKHQHDPAYDNVILHVVWDHDTAVFRKDGTQIPTFELKNSVLPNVLARYQNLLKSQESILCASNLKDCSELTKIQMLDKALANRLAEKSNFVKSLLKHNSDDWEETVYQILAKNFGFKLNSDSFLKLSQVLPLKILQKHKNSLFQIEALIFGMAGFLNDDLDEYGQKLKAEFEFLATKYQIRDQALLKLEWKFLRTRPGNFPTIRLAQFAMFIFNQSGFFSKIYEIESYETLREIFEIKQSDYWLLHYNFGKLMPKPRKGIGSASIDNIIINSIVSVLAAYSNTFDNAKYTERAVSFLEHIKAEKNYIIDIWAEKGFEIKSSFDSQALIQQYQHFCLKKRCVNCPIGVSILRK